MRIFVLLAKLFPFMQNKIKTQKTNWCFCNSIAFVQVEHFSMFVLEFAHFFHCFFCNFCDTKFFFWVMNIWATEKCSNESTFLKVCLTGFLYKCSQNGKIFFALTKSHFQFESWLLQKNCDVSHALSAKSLVGKNVPSWNNKFHSIKQNWKCFCNESQIKWG